MLKVGSDGFLAAVVYIKIGCSKNNWANVARNATKLSKCTLRGCGCGAVVEVRGRCGSAPPATLFASLASRIVKSST